MPTKKINWSPQARIGERRQQQQLIYSLLKDSHDARAIAAVLIQNAIEWHQVYRDVENKATTLTTSEAVIYDDNLLNAIENWLTQPDPRAEIDPKPKPLVRHPKLR